MSRLGRLQHADCCQGRRIHRARRSSESAGSITPASRTHVPLRRPRQVGTPSYCASPSSHSDPSAVEQLQPVELALGPDLLHGADGRVDQPEADAGERVVVATEGQQRGADDQQDRVEERRRWCAGSGRSRARTRGRRCCPPRAGAGPRPPAASAPEGRRSRPPHPAPARAPGPRRRPRGVCPGRRGTALPSHRSTAGSRFRAGRAGGPAGRRP